MVLKNPTGSNNLAISLRKFRLVSGKSYSGGLALNVKTSSPGNHVTPSVFTIGSPSLAMWTSDALLSTGILLRTLVEFDSHLWACIPALDRTRADLIVRKAWYLDSPLPLNPYYRPCKLTSALSLRPLGTRLCVFLRASEQQIGLETVKS